MAETASIEFFIPSDVEDDMLKGMITTTDVIAATSHVIRIAKSLGVDYTLIPTDPVPQDVADLAIAVACTRRCKLSIGMGTGEIDQYALKHKIYAKEVIERSANMTAVDMIPDDTAQYSSYAAEAIELVRG